MLKHIAKALGVKSGTYSQEVLMYLVLDEIERLKELEQACMWNRTIMRDPEVNPKTAIAAYSRWSMGD